MLQASWVTSQYTRLKPCMQKLTQTHSSFISFYPRFQRQFKQLNVKLRMLAYSELSVKQHSRGLRARPYWRTDHTKEGCYVISALFVNAPMRNLRFSVNELTDKAEITHGHIDRQIGGDGGSFLRMIIDLVQINGMIRPSTWRDAQFIE